MNARRSSLVLQALLLVGVSFASAPAAASPWTLRPGDFAMVATYDFTFGDREYLEDRVARRFPLGGSYRASTLTVGARVGITERFELELQVPLRHVSYRSDPVILNDPMMPADLDVFQDSVLDFDQSRLGVGDLFLTGRYSLYRRHPLALALEARLKVPTGYDSPQGTFGSNPVTAGEFVDRAAEVATAANIRDDVTLGDGQVDINVNALLGMSFSSRTFFRLDAGYNLRFGAGDQFLGSLKAGQQISSRVLLYAEARIAYTVTQGPRIGVSVAAVDPSLPAEDYRGFDNLRLRELRLERDALDMVVGGIVRITDSAELNVGYARTLWGKNTLMAQTFYLGIGVRLNLLSN